MPNTIVQTHTHDNLLLSKKRYEKERPTLLHTHLPFPQE